MYKASAGVLLPTSIIGSLPRPAWHTVQLGGRRLKHISPERMVISSDCGMGREGMSRRHAQYKMVAMVLGTNIVRKEFGLPEAECLAADPRHSLAL